MPPGECPASENVIVALPVRETSEGLWDFVHRNGHREAIRRRREWFKRHAESPWCSDGSAGSPARGEAVDRLPDPRAHGLSLHPLTFTFPASRPRPPAKVIPRVRGSIDTPCVMHTSAGVLPAHTPSSPVTCNVARQMGRFEALLQIPAYRGSMRTGATRPARPATHRARRSPRHPRPGPGCVARPSPRTDDYGGGASGAVIQAPARQGLYGADSSCRLTRPGGSGPVG
ncbi:DUF3291 domain-containing protein [Streptomyces sp. G-G2]|uniref:DUF3291 domain-containing protein n=1 Tax=Streptomyces sp. G-G2 TaxID=3046201 RepID=UPI0024BB70FC|nr:DUF3291 domain-containing protein [Streptomyces sp. G-G2]MDJ0383493.1 DUF3291 domain-containing protein [Streptomyces sp. G-G2]